MSYFLKGIGTEKQSFFWALEERPWILALSMKRHIMPKINYMENVLKINHKTCLKIACNNPNLFKMRGMVRYIKETRKILQSELHVINSKFKLKYLKN